MKVERHADGCVTLHYQDRSKTLKTPLDALFFHIHKTLGLCFHERKGSISLSAGFGNALRISHATTSRVRNGKDPIPEQWLFKMHVYSGIPYSELCEIAGVEPLVAPHPRQMQSLASAEMQALALIEKEIKPDVPLATIGYRVTRIIQGLREKIEDEAAMNKNSEALNV